ncbi:MAG: threonine--tRNA ligase [Pseudomonadota bacterium]
MYIYFLKDGKQLNFDSRVNAYDIAHKISPSLAKKAVAAKVNDGLWDLMRILPDGAKVEIITKDTSDGLEILRHDCAHILAQAIKDEFPSAQITIGPAIENGFYYDIYAEKPFTLDDFAKLEKRMAAIIDKNDQFIREEWDRTKAIEFFKSIGEEFKAQIIHDLPPTETITLYRQGPFIDLCRGPHMPSTGMVGKNFKLMKVSGAYWRGDQTKEVLQRIYGTAWWTEKDLADYLHRLEEAEKRDHRKLGPQLGLFHIQEEAVGSIFWHPKGWTLYRLLEDYIRTKLKDHDYQEVRTPLLVDKKLWEESGHWEKFSENMFVVQDDDRILAVKPMNCPCHVQIFKQGMKSYRDLPLRMAEFGCCHRNEPRGALHGIMRVRSFTQDDAHIFCTPDQIIEETKTFCDLLKMIYIDLGFTNIRIKFSDRPEKRAGSDAIWDLAENALREASIAAGLDFTLNPGEGAFYGPKLEFVLVDAIGRDWQCGTFQVDFVLPQRLGAHYVDEQGEKKHPVMLHRAILGSMERFIGILIENYAGAFPVWLAPVQTVITTITEKHSEYAQKIYNDLKAKGVRCELDIRNEKISYKVREHSLQKIPYIITIGDNEMTTHTLTVRAFGQTTNETMSLEKFLTMVI